MSGTQQSLYFVFSSLINLYIMALWFRFALRVVNVSSVNAFSQAIFKITNPVVTAIESFFFPSNYVLKKYDMPCLVSIIMIEVLKYALLSLIVFFTIMPISYWLMFVIVSLIVQALSLLFYVTLTQAILSFFPQNGQASAAMEVLSAITNPLLNPIRKLIPLVGNFDISPVILMILIKAVTIFIGSFLPLAHFGL